MEKKKKVCIISLMHMRLQKILDHNVVGRVGAVGYSDLPLIVILTNEKVQKNHSFATFLLNDSICLSLFCLFPTIQDLHQQ